MNPQDLKKVLKFIEENIRVTDQTTIEYLDPKGHISRLDSKQNQVIFGRRGSGKSLLMKSLKENTLNVCCLSINLEDFKDISFPNSIIQVLKSLIHQLIIEVKDAYPFWNFFNWLKARSIKKELLALIKTLEQRLIEPDVFNEEIKQTKGNKILGKGKSKSSVAVAEVSAERSEEIETSKKIKIDKLNILKNELPLFKSIINRSSNLLNKTLFLILDDFYFIRKSDQPYFIDFFHRLSKNTNLYLKVATIKHRTSLYLQGETYIGIEIGHDAQELNLDYSLENFSALVTFMKDLLEKINDKVQVSINYDNILTENAFRFLCLASGGVPRDFFSLFIALGNKILSNQGPITKPNVIECSIENLPNKFEAFKTDSAEEKEILEHYLQYLRQEVVDRRRYNSFLISNSEVLRFPQINQAIKELVDLRLLHLVNSNTSSAPSDGLRYSAYMIDIGMFPNANPRNFQQIEPGQKDDKGREDRIRSAPKINLTAFKEYIDQLKLKTDLTLTE